MTVYIGLLRAVNVGGTGKLPMAELRAICNAAGFSKVQTYIASGNVVFHSAMSATHVKSCLEESLKSYFKKQVGVVIRTADELSAVLQANPFKKAAPSRIVALFLDDLPSVDALKHAVGQNHEELRLGAREIYVHYVDGIGRSKLKIPAASGGTARNMNTVAKLVAIASETKD
jgi:uncharacterized protein (DUF1697 family)